MGFAIAFGACKKKEELTQPKAPEAVVAGPVAEVAPKISEATPSQIPAEVRELSVSERAAKLGFSKFLPPETEAVISTYNGSKTASRVKASKFWKLVVQEIGGAGPFSPPMVEPQAEPADGEAENFQGDGETDENDSGVLADEPVVEPEAVPGDTGPAALFGSEVTVAIGNSGGEQFKNLLTLESRMSYFQVRNLARAMIKNVQTGDFDSSMNSFWGDYGTEIFKDLANDPESGMTMVERSNMPPVYVAFKTSAEERESSAQQIASLVESLIQMGGPLVEPIKFESAGSAFEGVKLIGAKYAEMLAEERESLESEYISPELVDRLIAAVAEKDLLIVSGIVDEYVVLFLGASQEDLKLVQTAEESLVAGEALKFSDEYVAKELVALVYGEKEALANLAESTGWISNLTNAIRDGVTGPEGLTDTRDLESLFQMVEARENALRKLSGTEGAGIVAFFEDGLKIESHGGTDSGMVDWNASNSLGHLGDGEDVFLFSNVSVDAAFNQKSREYLEALLETSYALMIKLSELPVQGEQMIHMKKMAGILDADFRPDMVALWDAFSGDFGSGLGPESAIVIDLKGTAPAIPGLTQKLVDQLKVPRLSLIRPVVDRSKISDSWEKMNLTLTGALAKFSKISGQDIPMQKPMSSERNGNFTWYFPMPFFNDDFLPSVTVGEKWFALSSSKVQALDLISRADSTAPPKQGLNFAVNFKVLERYAKQTSELLEQNPEALKGNAPSVSDLQSINDAISVLQDFDKLTIHSRREANVVRSSIHFKTR